MMKNTNNETCNKASAGYLFGRLFRTFAGSGSLATVPRVRKTQLSGRHIGWLAKPDMLFMGIIAKCQTPPLIFLPKPQQ